MSINVTFCLASPRIAVAMEYVQHHLCSSKMTGTQVCPHVCMDHTSQGVTHSGKERTHVAYTHSVRTPRVLLSALHCNKKYSQGHAILGMQGRAVDMKDLWALTNQPPRCWVACMVLGCRHDVAARVVATAGAATLQ